MKILFAGLGGIGQRHLRNLRRLRGDSVEVTAWRTRGETHTLTDRLEIEPGVDVEERYGVRCVSDLEKALAGRPDAVFVCNPTALHVNVALAAARAGCDIFIEKPVSDRLEHTEELVALVTDNRLVASVGYQFRFHPLFLKLQTTVKSGVLGPICAVRAEVGEYLPGWHTYEDYRTMYASRRDLGGGVLLTQIHEFDYLYCLFGRPHRIFAMGGHLSRLDIDVEDAASVLMNCESEGRSFPVRLDLDYLQRPPFRGCTVIGDRGKVVIDFGALTSQRFDEEGRCAESETLEGFQRNDLFVSELADFLDCIETRRTSSVPLAEGLQSLEMALAARKSLESGNVVELRSSGRMS